MGGLIGVPGASDHTVDLVRQDMSSGYQFLNVFELSQDPACKIPEEVYCLIIFYNNEVNIDCKIVVNNKIISSVEHLMRELYIYPLPERGTGNKRKLA